MLEPGSPARLKRTIPSLSVSADRAMEAGSGWMVGWVPCASKNPTAKATFPFEKGAMRAEKVAVNFALSVTGKKALAPVTD